MVSTQDTATPGYYKGLKLLCTPGILCNLGLLFLIETSYLHGITNNEGRVYPKGLHVCSHGF